MLLELVLVFTCEEEEVLIKKSRATSVTWTWPWFIDLDIEQRDIIYPNLTLTLTQVEREKVDLQTMKLYFKRIFYSIPHMKEKISSGLTLKMLEVFLQCCKTYVTKLTLHSFVKCVYSVEIHIHILQYRF